MTDMMNQIEKVPSQGHEASNISPSRAEGVDPSVTEHACDVLVIGSGAGGLSTAVAAAHRGLDVLVVEKEPVFGGTTARSGGWMWIPNNAPAKRAGAARLEKVRSSAPQSKQGRTDREYRRAPAIRDEDEEVTVSDYGSVLAGMGFSAFFSQQLGLEERASCDAARV